MLQLAGIVAVGVLSLAAVAATEVQTRQFTTAFTAAADSQQKAETLFQQVVQRPGGWTAQHSADMRTVASLFTTAADTLAASTAPAALVWYRDGLAANLREAAAVASELAQQTSGSSQATFDALATRWNKRIGDYEQLRDRLDAQTR